MMTAVRMEWDPPINDITDTLSEKAIVCLPVARRNTIELINMGQSRSVYPVLTYLIFMTMNLRGMKKSGILWLSVSLIRRKGR